jgi:hypothetical protein
VRIGRTGAVAGTAGLGAALLGVAAAPWLAVPVATVLARSEVAVSGADAVPAVPAAALVLLAGGLALALAGALARRVASAAVAVAGVVAVVATGRFLADPGEVALTAAAAATGVREVAGPVATTPWPAVAIVVGALAGAGGGVLLATARQDRAGATPSRRFDRAGARGPGPGGVGLRTGVGAPPAAAGDAPAGDSRDVPTGAMGDGRDARVGAADDGPGARVRAMDDWDALSRGEDPS